MFDNHIFCAILISKGEKSMKQFLIFGVFFQLLKGKRTASEIAEVYEVSPRTIYRYIDALCLAGVPVVCKQGKGGGIYIDDSFDCRKYMNRYMDSNNKNETHAYKTL